MATAFWVVGWTPARPWSEIARLLPDHLAYLGELERQGRVFASGPFPGDDGEPDGTGMTVLRAASAVEAEQLAAGDPLALAGLRRYTVRRWVVVEGGFTITVRYSDVSFAMGGAV
jgi:uncharacterized protein